MVIILANRQLLHYDVNESKFDIALVLPIHSSDRLIENLFLVIMGFPSGHLGADGLPFPPISFPSFAVESQ